MVNRAAEDAGDRSGRRAQLHGNGGRVPHSGARRRNCAVGLTAGVCEAAESQTRIFVLTDRGISYTSDGIDANQKPTHAEYSANFDGKDYPLTGAPNADTIAPPRLDPYTLEVTQKRNGNVVISGRRTISKDGRTATVTNKGVDASGRQIDNMLVFEKR